MILVLDALSLRLAAFAKVSNIRTSRRKVVWVWSRTKATSSAKARSVADGEGTEAMTIRMNGSKTKAKNAAGGRTPLPDSRVNVETFMCFAVEVDVSVVVGVQCLECGDDVLGEAHLP